jgi:hypothetical protein
MEVQRIKISEQDRQIVSAFMGEQFPNEIDFNWLMPACHKWDELEGFKRGEESDQYENLCDFLDQKVTLYEILPVWEQLVKNIEWYNQSKNTQS